MGFHSPAGLGGPDGSYHSKWLSELHARAPQWRITSWTMNTKAYLPQNRPRIYTVGINASLMLPMPLPPPIPPSASRPCLASIMHPALPSNMEHLLTRQQRTNLQDAKAQLSGSPAGLRGDLCTVSLDRNPAATFKPTIMCGIVGCLRTSNDLIWLLQVKEGRTILSRCIHPMERCALQGYMPEQVRDMSKSDLLRCLGNGFSTPVVGSVFKQIASVLCHFMVPAPSAGCSRPAEELEHARKRHRTCINLLRESIALKEWETHLWSRKVSVISRSL